jgi:uncharacterized SAM-binding protein YcdF (DUF218 family)
MTEDNTLEYSVFTIEPEPEAVVEHGRPRERPRWWRRIRWRRVVLAAAGVVVAYYVVTVFQVIRAGRDQQPESAEVIVVLGAAQYDGTPSPQLAARLDHALLLFNDGVAPRVMVTGGNRPGDRFTEAEASLDYLVERGVPAEAIMVEDQGRTTYESLDLAAVQLLAAGLQDVVLVTDPYHSLRSRLVAAEVGLDPSLSPTQTSVVTGWTEFRKDLYEAGGVAVGRIIGFDRLSDLTG